MSLTAPDPAPAGRSTNVRLVVVDDRRQPQYLIRAKALEQALLTAANALGVEADDMPGLHGLCVEAMRSAERQGR
jgi:hypothetical protein